MYIRIQDTPHFNAGPVQQHTLISLAYRENITNLFGTDSFNIPQGNNLPLIVWQPVNGLLNSHSTFLGQQGTFRRIRFPTLGRIDPVSFSGSFRDEERIFK
jgi:hypothetical protein